MTNTFYIYRIIESTRMESETKKNTIHCNKNDLVGLNITNKIVLQRVQRRNKTHVIVYR